MSTYSLPITGNTSLEASYTDGGDKSGVKLSITDVRYNNTTNQLEVDWSFTMRAYTTIRLNCAAAAAWIGGTQVSFKHGTTWLYTYTEYRDGTVIQTGTHYISASKGTTQSITLSVKGMFMYGWTQTRWDNGTGCTTNSSTISVPVPGNPSITLGTSYVASSINGSTGSVTGKASAVSAGTNGGNYAYYITVDGDKGSKNASKTKSGLKNNQSYTVSATVTNDYGLSDSVSTTVTLNPLAPVIGSVSATPTRTGATLTPTVTYDNKRKYGSYSIRYGTTTSYGSTSSSLTLSGLTPNTKYYYSITVTDANNGGVYASALTSSAYTGSFTTTGNAPSITSVSASVTRTGVALTPTVTYDTNAAFSSYSVKYGKTTSYGSTSSSNTLSGLTANTTYYYSITVKDNKNRTSVAYTGSFTTTGNVPTISGITATPERTKATLSATVTYDTNAAFSSYSVRYGTTTSYGSTSTSLTLSGLSANTKYYYSVTVTDNKNRTSAAVTGSFTTTGNAPSITNVSVSVTRTGATLTPAVTYDTNASFSSYSIKYGKTTSYGSTSTSASLTGLSANTKYYYNITVKDTKSRTSSAYTGGFTTSGNAPTINSLAVTPDKFTAVFDPSISYDNTSFASYSIRYGTTTSYGSTSTSLTLSGLLAETKYYYEFKVTDAAGRSSTITGNFTTLSDQAKVWIKTSSGQKRGKVWMKTSEWNAVQKIYEKVSTWKAGVNQ